MINEYLLNAVCSTSATGSFLSFLFFQKVIRRALQDVKVVMELERFGRDFAFVKLLVKLGKVVPET